MASSAGLPLADTPGASVNPPVSAAAARDAARRGMLRDVEQEVTESCKRQKLCATGFIEGSQFGGIIFNGTVKFNISNVTVYGGGKPGGAGGRDAPNPDGRDAPTDPSHGCPGGDGPCVSIHGGSEGDENALAVHQPAGGSLASLAIASSLNVLRALADMETKSDQDE